MDQMNLYFDNTKLDMYKAFLTESPLNKIVSSIVAKKSAWIDKTIRDAVPEWKLKILQKVNTTIIRKLLNVNLEIITEELIGNFGNQTIIKIIGKFKFKPEINYGEITTDVYKTSYSLINDDGIVRCAWCRKPEDEIENIDEHIDKHVEEDKNNG